MAAVKRSVSFDEALAGRIDAARGETPFSTWLANAARLRLATPDVADGVQAVTPQVGSGSSGTTRHVRPGPDDDALRTDLLRRQAALNAAKLGGKR